MITSEWDYLHAIATTIQQIPTNIAIAHVKDCQDDDIPFHMENSFTSSGIHGSY
ncbi:MAG: hypothetical protein AAF518_18935 [Spirochaetota bacterium]